MNDEPVSAIAANGPDFEIAADPQAGVQPPDRCGVQPRGGHHLGPGVHHCLAGSATLRWARSANAGGRRHQRGALAARARPAHDRRAGDRRRAISARTSCTSRSPPTASSSTCAPRARKRSTEPWTDHGVATEQLIVSTGGAPGRPHAVRAGAGARRRRTRPATPTTTCASPTTSPTSRRCTKKAGGLLVAELFTSSGQRVEPEVVRSRTSLPALTAETADPARPAADGRLRRGGHRLDRRLRRDHLPHAPRHVHGLRSRESTAAGSLEPVYRWSFVTSRYRTFAAHLADLRALPWHERLPAARLRGHRNAARPVRRSWRRKTKRGGRSGRPSFGYPDSARCPSGPKSTMFWTQPAAFEARRPVVRQPGTALRLRPHRARAQAHASRVRLHSGGPAPDRVVARRRRTASSARSTARERCSFRSTPPVSRCGCLRAAIGADFVYKLTGVAGSAGPEPAGRDDRRIGLVELRGAVRRPIRSWIRRPDDG